ncbi:MAG TPA: GNAT family N-acetyltransferase [Candidatus Limnocylindrales bacterium]|nr:GNAT family N-acetyltransferase [Candidatus Limnocylindrales bacterium]
MRDIDTTETTRAPAAAISLRDATSEDAEFLARVMLIATRSHLGRGAWDYLLGWEESATLEFLAQLAVSEPEHLFTYSRFVVATVDGEPAAAASGYRPERHGFAVYLPVFDELLRTNGVTDPEYSQIWARGDVLQSAGAGPVAPGAWIIESVATLPAFRGMGLVDRLLADLLQRGTASGCDRALIETVFVGNDPARRAYLKHGFLPVRETSGDGWQDIFGSPGFEILERLL